MLRHKQVNHVVLDGHRHSGQLDWRDAAVVSTTRITVTPHYMTVNSWLAW
jgi:hypothetical protein